MNIRDSILINCTPDKVWRFVENPEFMKRWNPKVQWVSAADKQREKGYEYGIMYVMNDKADQFRGEYIVYDPPRLLVIRLTSEALQPSSFVEECYTLTEKGSATMLEQSIEFHNSGVNIFARMLVAFIMRFGKPVGKRYLETLKEMVEEEGRRRNDE